MANSNTEARDMKHLNYYQVLNISSLATPAEIRSAFKKQSRLRHPDWNQSNGTMDEFLEVLRAYKTLRNDNQRASYDKMLAGEEKARMAKARFMEATRPGWERELAAKRQMEWEERQKSKKPKMEPPKKPTAKASSAE